MSTKPTKLQLHVLSCKQCTNCSYHETKLNTVVCRGTFPCDVLFVGEAPGKHEDLRGVPFIGPAGQLLQDLINQSFPKTVTYGFTNLICCLPVDPSTGEKAVTPDKKSIKACSPNLDRLIRLSFPRMIVRVGSLAEKYVPLLPVMKERSIPSISIVHPAFILRSRPIEQSLLIRKTLVNLVDGLVSVNLINS